ncbi:MAG: ribose 5-phosphate isomerase B [Oscillospiraceae bacterium]|nr:ribose 5-phosphate isomerase B [Oscillospiraceae bacterium]
MIALASDHAGLELKGVIARYLDERGLQYTDFGTHTAASCNYPEFGLKAAQAVASGQCERGILVCGTGFGISLAANKVRGIRCVNCSEPYTAVLSRGHNNTNMISLGARVIGHGLAISIVEGWLDAQFEAGRHQDRIEMISRYEESGV